MAKANPNAPLSWMPILPARLVNFFERTCKLWWILSFVMPMLWLFDRTPPLTVLDHHAPPPAAYAGDWAVFNVPVRRDTTRNCSAHYTRYLLDSLGRRHDYGGLQIITSDSIRASDKIQGPWVNLSVPIPKSTTAGDAELVTDIEYSCNPIHALWPIEVTLRFPLTVKTPPAAVILPDGDYSDPH